jgi:hypothetical protein
MSTDTHTTCNPNTGYWDHSALASENARLRSLVIRLVAARNARVEAKKALIAKAVEAGICRKMGKQTADGPIDICHREHPGATGVWCDSCKAKLPLWDDYRRKAAAAGAALRALLREGSKL